MILCKGCGECNWELVEEGIKVTAEEDLDLYQCKSCKRVVTMEKLDSTENCKKTDYV